MQRAYRLLDLWPRLSPRKRNGRGRGTRPLGAKRFLGVRGALRRALRRALRTRCKSLQYFSDFPGPGFFFLVRAFNPDALGAFCQSKYPGPGAP